MLLDAKLSALGSTAAAIKTQASTNPSAYFSGVPRVNAYLAWENDFLNQDILPNGTYYQTLEPDPRINAQLNCLMRQVGALQAEANLPITVKHGDSIPYGMDAPLWPTTFGMFPCGITSPTIFMGGYNPFAFNIGVPRTNVRASASLGIGNLLGAPLNAVGGALSGMGDALLDFSGWSG